MPYIIGVMDERTDIQLLREWLDHRDREAVGELIRRHIDFVLNTARRQVGNDIHLAEDITQAVFILFLQKAHRIKSEAAMAGWLFNTTRFAASNARRMNRRREHYEQQAAARLVEANEPNDGEDAQLLLNEAIARLSKGDRQCVVMSYLQQKSHRQVAEALGVSENTARMRVSRAVRRMRDFFAARGVAGASEGMMASLLVAGKSTTASAVLIESTLNIATLSQAAGGSVSAMTIAKGVSKMIFAMKVKAAAAITVVIFGGAVTAQVIQNALSHTAATVMTSQIQAAPDVDPSNISLGDGVSVKVIGIAKWQSTDWHDINGKSIPAPSTRRVMMQIMPPPTHQLVLHVDSPADALQLAKVLRAGNSMGSQSLNTGSGQDHMMAFTANNGSDTVDVDVRVATSPWKTVMTIPTATGRRGAFGMSSPTFSATFTPLLEVDGKTVVYVSTAQGDNSWRLVCKDINGLEVEGQPGSGAGSPGVMMREFKWDLAPVTIGSLQIQTRDYNKHVTIKNISLDPAKPTKPEIVIEAPKQ